MRFRSKLLIASAAFALSLAVLLAREIYHLPSLDELPRRLAARTASTPRANWVPLWAISSKLQTAVVVWEDPAFFHHSGLSLAGIFRALAEDVRAGQFKRGGSTITQQVAKNLFLTKEKTLRRKFDEAILAWRLERRYSKNQLLEIYLNVADWGESDSGELIVGAEAAARYYFHKSAADMTWSEAALLAGVLPNPIHNGPFIDPVSARILRDRVLHKLLADNKITPGEFDQALASPCCGVARLPPVSQLGRWSPRGQAVRPVVYRPDVQETRASPAPAVSEAPSPNRLADHVPVRFLECVPANLTLPRTDDTVGIRLLGEYGAMFVANGGAVPPPVVLFPNAAEAAAWQSSLDAQRATFAGISVKLQTPAMRALQAVRADAAKLRLDVLPYDSDSAQRSYGKSLALWNYRVASGLRHWRRNGSITASEAVRIRELPLPEQAREILTLETRRLYFGDKFAKSILFSVAVPGASQHLSLLAFDVKEHEDARVRSILEAHGWFQTVRCDLLHFTYLGMKKEQLPGRGLKMIKELNREFWVPDFAAGPDADRASVCGVPQVHAQHARD